MLGLLWHDVFVFLELLFNVPWHEDINRLVDVIPVQFNYAVKVPRPIFGECICLFYACYKMIYIRLIYIFYAEIVNDEGKQDRSCFAGPQPWSVDTLVIPEQGQLPTESFVGEDARLRKAPHGTSHF